VSTTPLQGMNYSAPVYADPAATMSGGTPLILAVSRADKAGEYHLTVKLQLLQAYERAIFELQQQVVHYKALIEGLLPMPESPELLRFEATPLNAASVRLLNSIIEARMPVSPRRGLDEPEET
jgi:hypothetical protein